MSGSDTKRTSGIGLTMSSVFEGKADLLVEHPDFSVWPGCNGHQADWCL